MMMLLLVMRSRLPSVASAVRQKKGAWGAIRKHAVLLLFVAMAMLVCRCVRLRSWTTEAWESRQVAAVWDESSTL